MFDGVSPLKIVSIAADLTTPDVSLIFLLLFGVLAYFHEDHFAYTSIALLCWAALQVANYSIQEDFRSSIFWSVLGLLGNFAFYLFLGYAWSFAKLYLEILQGHYKTEILACVMLSHIGDAGTLVPTSYGTECIFNFILSLKWQIARWTITWPMSVAHTLTRDPLRVFTDLAFEWSRQRYVWIVTSALAASEQSPSSSSSPLTAAAWTIAYAGAYALIGYAWTHIKLFIDVWQGALPPTLDAEVNDLYTRKQSYWDFVRKIKWHVIQWMITWPVSMIYTIARHPLRMLADLIYRLSQRKYMFIVSKAMEMRMKQE
jgi:hypothetical protein